VMASDKYLMALGADWEKAKAMFDKGVNLVTCMSDTLSIGALARKNVQLFKETVL